MRKVKEIRASFFSIPVSSKEALKTREKRNLQIQILSNLYDTISNLSQIFGYIDPTELFKIKLGGKPAEEASISHSFTILKETVGVRISKFGLFASTNGIVIEVEIQIAML